MDNNNNKNDDNKSITACYKSDSLTKTMNARNNIQLMRATSVKKYRRANISIHLEGSHCFTLSEVDQMIIQHEYSSLATAWRSPVH